MEEFRWIFVSLATNSGIWTKISSTNNRGKPISIDEICDGVLLLFPRLVISIATIMVAMFCGTYFISITTNFISRRYRDENWSPCVFYIVALKLICFNSFSMFCRSIDKIIVPITTKIWPKTVRKIFGSTQNRGKPISIDEICKLNDNFSMKLRLYSDGIRGKPLRVSTVL